MSEAKDLLRELGLILWSVTYQRKPNLVGDELVTLAREACESFENSGESAVAPLAQWLRAYLDCPAGMLECYQAATWIHFGMPTLQLSGHRYAAALAATAVYPEEVIKPPWPVFLLELPTGMFDIATKEGALPLTDVVVSVFDQDHPSNGTGKDQWSISARGPHPTKLVHLNAPLACLTDTVNRPLLEDIGLDSTDPTERDRRTLELLAKLAINTCIAMSDPDNVKPIGKHPSGSPGNFRQTKEPLYRVYRVGKPIELDVRPAIQDYINGKRHGASPTVQFVVRGHWRNQACGLKLSQRKIMWIKPYWKGPEDAPINVRSHVLKDTETPVPPV
jgi:hypothetical protein